jgi:hypothetical protein
MSPRIADQEDWTTRALAVLQKGILTRAPYRYAIGLRAEPGCFEQVCSSRNGATLTEHETERFVHSVWTLYDLEARMQPKTSPAYTCPWCPYTDALLKKIIQHMESAHHRRWCDLALYPPIAGGEPI